MSCVRNAMALVLLVILAAAGPSAATNGFKVLHSFCKTCGNGTAAWKGLVADASGNLFGITFGGGDGHLGTAFELERSGNGHYSFQTIHTFYYDGAEGSNPYSSLIIDVHGNLYGGTLQGGAQGKGAAYELVKTDQGEWPAKVLHTFCSKSDCQDGDSPAVGLSYVGMTSGQPYDGHSPLYGTTTGGGRYHYGTAYELTLKDGKWTEQVIHDFCTHGDRDCADGNKPFSALLADASGNLYGTTSGPLGGVLFELIAKTWEEIPLYHFCQKAACSDGSSPIGNLAMDANGNIYGVTSEGGKIGACTSSFGCGTIFKLVPNGANSTLTTLHSFCQQSDCKDGRILFDGLIVDGRGNLFGTTDGGGGHDNDQYETGGGVVYELRGRRYKILHRFCSQAHCDDGANPNTELMMDGSGILFGTTQDGGAYDGTYGGGVVFQLKP